jgi:hypothetical protein
MRLDTARKIQEKWGAALPLRFLRSRSLSLGPWTTLHAMPTKLPVDEHHPLCGTWYDHSQDTDDYVRAEYTVTAVDGQFQVSAVDRSDHEAFVISDVCWDGEWLSFTSFMPSTRRRGHNRMRYLDTHEIEFLFTFTVREVWRRKHAG